MYESVLLAAADGEKAWRDLEPAHGLQEVHLGGDVGGQRLGGGLPRGGHEALRGEVHDVGGLGGLEEVPHRREVAQVALDEADPAAEMIDVLGLAPPANGAEDLGALRERELGHMAADEAGDAGDQDPHVPHASPSLDRADYTVAAAARRYTSATSAAIRSTEKSRRARVRPAAPNARARAGSARSAAAAAARAPGSSTGTRTPVFPSTTVSTWPGTRLAMTG